MDEALLLVGLSATLLKSKKCICRNRAAAAAFESSTEQSVACALLCEVRWRWLAATHARAAAAAATAAKYVDRDIFVGRSAWLNASLNPLSFPPSLSQ